MSYEILSSILDDWLNYKKNILKHVNLFREFFCLYFWLKSSGQQIKNEVQNSFERALLSSDEFYSLMHFG